MLAAAKHAGYHARLGAGTDDRAAARWRARLGSLYITTPDGAADTGATIRHLAADYVAHLRHHLDQIRRLLS